MLLRGRPAGKIRAAEFAARTRAFSGARLAISESLSMEVAAERAGSKLSTVQEAVSILRFGTAEEIVGVEAGTMSMRDVGDAIRKRVPKEERWAVKHKPIAAPRIVETREFESEVWSKVRQALDILTGLPNPDDVMNIIKKHPQRTETTSRKVLTAHTWLEEFVNAWTK